MHYFQKCAGELKPFMKSIQHYGQVYAQEIMFVSSRWLKVILKAVPNNISCKVKSTVCCYNTQKNRHQKGYNKMTLYSNIYISQIHYQLHSWFKGIVNQWDFPDKIRLKNVFTVQIVLVAHTKYTNTFHIFICNNRQIHFYSLLHKLHLLGDT